MTIDHLLNLHGVKHLRAILGILAGPNVLGWVELGFWHFAVCCAYCCLRVGLRWLLFVYHPIEIVTMQR